LLFAAGAAVLGVGPGRSSVGRSETGSTKRHPTARRCRVCDRSSPARVAAGSYCGHVDAEQHDLQGQIDLATQRLTSTVIRLSADDVRQPSLLPGWSRGHVLTHLARSADAMRNLLAWAWTGAQTPAYASEQARDADIALGADRSVAELLADLVDSGVAFRSWALALPDRAWRVPVRVLADPEFPAAQLLIRRLVEVELHHTDLGAGYQPDGWPASFVAMDLPEPMLSQRASRGS
jgi:maleylpyruvate isomerase